MRIGGVLQQQRAVALLMVNNAMGFIFGVSCEQYKLLLYRDYHSIMIIVSVVEYSLLVLYLEYHNGIRDCCI